MHSINASAMMVMMMLLGFWLTEQIQKGKNSSSHAGSSFRNPHTAPTAGLGIWPDKCHQELGDNLVLGWAFSVQIAHFPSQHSPLPRSVTLPQTCRVAALRNRRPRLQISFSPDSAPPGDPGLSQLSTRMCPHSSCFPDNKTEQRSLLSPPHNTQTLFCASLFRESLKLLPVRISVDGERNHTL